MAAQLSIKPDSTDLNALVEFKAVRKLYHNVVAVDSLNLAVRRGEFLTFLGPSGSGKTTILMMLAGFEAIDQGEIFLAGRPLSPIPPHHRNIGMVFQSYALFPNLTVFENIAFPLKVRNIGREEIQRRVRDALTMIRLSEYGNRRPSQLSGGQQQRVALARALIFNPELVLLDEPLGALDRQLREQLQAELRELQQRLGVTMIYVTHDQTEALTMSDRVAVFNAGKLEQLDKPAALYDRPRTPFVAEFLGENNRIAGRVTSVGGSQCTVAISEAISVRAIVHWEAKKGDRVTVFVRPERVTLLGVGTHENVSEACVERVVFLGDQLRLHLRLPGNIAVFMKVPHTPGGNPPSPGETLRVGWQPEYSTAFPV
jgi:putative spermidine/putrescine transport system ATP-binding protein